MRRERKALSSSITAIMILMMATPAAVLTYHTVDSQLSDKPTETSISGELEDKKSVRTGSTRADSENVTPEIDLSFSWSPEDPVAGEKVFFELKSTQDFVSSYSWSPDREKIFSSSGRHEITVSAELENGSVFSNTRTINVEPRKEPSAGFDFTPSEPVKGEIVAFDASKSSDNDVVETYEWSFLDSERTGETVRYNFPSNGSKQVSLKVTDSDGFTDTVEKTVEVLSANRPPQASIDYGGSLQVNYSIVFNASGSTDDGTIEQYYWDFAEGSFEKGDAQETREFGINGSKTVRVKVVDDQGMSDVFSVNFTIQSNQKPSSEIVYEPESIVRGENLNFSSQSSDSDGQIVENHWDFDSDGSYETTGDNVSWDFSSSGEKTVTLRSIDNDGAEATATTTLNVEDNQLPVADLSNNFFVFRKDVSESLDASSSYDPDGDITKYEWDWEADGVYEETGPNPSYSFSSTGVSNFKLRLTDNNGGKAVVSREKQVVSNSCEKYRVNGYTSDKADTVLVARNYSSRSNMMSDFDYYMDFEQQHRGLFDVYPMNVSMEKFNVWIVDAGVGNIGDYGDDMIPDATEYFDRCGFADYKVLMSKDDYGSSGFAVSGHRMFIPSVSDKVDEQNGAVALIHEWGHGFGGLKDEYHKEDGRDASGRPNCAPTREKAEEWWGDLADSSPKVGFEQGCAYQEDNWEPHPGGTIMGDGGLWHYGPVNDRVMLEELSQYS